MKSAIGFLCNYYSAKILIPMALGITLGLLSKMGWEAAFYLGLLGFLCHFWAEWFERSVYREYIK